MLFGRKKVGKAIALMEEGAYGEDYWSIIKKQFKRNRLSVWSLRILIFLLFIALTSDFIANEKPIYCKIKGETHWPIFKDYLVPLGLSEWGAEFTMKRWSEHKYDKVIYPLIPYSAETPDPNNMGYVEPGRGDQNVPSKWFRHRLGTDEIGRDVAAGLISGTRTAMLVGVVSMSVAAIIGILLGGIAGYFGDDRMKMSRGRLFLNLVGSFFALYYGFLMPASAFSQGSVFKGFFIFILIILGANLLSPGLKLIPFFRKKITIWADFFIMRLIEIINSIPGLLLILSILPILQNPSILHIMVIIGLIFWTGIARFIRGELLRVRSLEYIEAAKALGYGEWRIMFKHAIPNALTPVLITLAFGIASAVLLEAFISFLGIGLPDKLVTWGSMLNEARGRPSAWWLAIFPGMAIFVTVLIFNLIGEGLTEALNPKLRK